MRRGHELVQQGGGVQRHAVTQLLQLGAACHRAVAALYQVVYQWRAAAELPADLLHLRDRLRRLDEQGVGPGFQVALGPLQGILEAVDAQGVGAGYEQRAVVEPRIQGCAYLAHHFSDGNHGFAGHVPAALGGELVFHLQGAGAGPFQVPHCALHVQGVAETGIHVHDQGDGHPVSQHRHGFAQLRGAHQAHVGAAEAGEGEAGAGQEGAVEARLFHQQRRQAVVYPGYRQHPVGLQLSLQPGAMVHARRSQALSISRSIWYWNRSG